MRKHRAGKMLNGLSLVYYISHWYLSPGDFCLFSFGLFCCGCFETRFHLVALACPGTHYLNQAEIRLELRLQMSATIPDFPWGILCSVTLCEIKQQINTVG